MGLAFESATELAARVRRKEISARELTDLYIERIERHDDALNAVIVRDFEAARAAADQADAELARGEARGPFHGLPVTIKESYDMTGHPTTWGIPEYAENRATGDAETVRRLKSAGAHFLGKTNVPLQLGDFQSFNEIYGTTRNPWNPERTPGGSSGGSAVALAAGFTALEHGSDIGGSIRNPAHFNGVYGHKPTWGVVPDQGHALPGMTASPDIAVCGPLARSAEDLAASMDVVAGADPFRERGWQLALPKPEKRSLREFRVAIWPTDPNAPVTTEVADRVQAVGDRLAKLGATVSDQARPEIDLAAAFETYLYMLHGVMGAGLPDPVLEHLVASEQALDPEDRSPTATTIRASVARHGAWLRQDHARARLRLAWRRFFDDWDVVLCPVTASTAFPHDHSPLGSRTLDVDGESRDYFEQVYWAGLATVAYLPSTVFPTGPTAEGLPLGIQAMGAEFDDLRTIDFARLMAEEFGGFQPPPGFAD